MYNGLGDLSGIVFGDLIYCRLGWIEYMIYLLGGSARTGKTTIAKRILEDKNISYFSIDYLMMGIANGIPELKVNPESNAFLIGRQLWCIIEPMMTTMIENGTTCLFEGSQLIPRNVKHFSDRYVGEVCAAFLGFSDVDPIKKAHEIEDFPGTENNWVENCSFEDIVNLSNKFIEFSKDIHRECQKYGLKYFDLSKDYDETVNEVIRYLVQK